MTRHTHIVVVGAGIVGIAAALWLQRDGLAVTVIDPGPPGSGASSGNAGCFSPSSIVPLSGPGILRQIPGWLLDPQGPLAIRWHYLPRLAPWLLRFIRAGTPARIEHQAAALARLLASTSDDLASLLHGTGAEPLIERRGSLIVYRTEAGWTGAEPGWNLRRRNAVAWEELTPIDLLDLEPALSPGLYRGVLLTGNSHTVDPHALVRRLAEAFLLGGGQLLATRVTSFDVADGRLRSVQTASGTVAASGVVLAAGARSGPLARMLGDRVPLETERGYHLNVGAPPVPLHRPVLSAEDRFVATPMTAGTRLTGTIELAGLASPPDWRRARALLPLGQRLFPGLPAGPGTTWMGHRPSMPDSLPVIGRSSRTPDVVYAFGHGHLGLTGAPTTGRLVADLVQGRTPEIDLSPFGASRFRPSWTPRPGSA